MKKQHLILVSAILLIVVGIIWLTHDRRSSSPALIGAVLPLTGDLSYFGQPEKIALDLAIKDLVQSSILEADDFVFRVEDSKSNPRDGITATRKLVDSNPSAVITSLTMVSLPSLPILQENSIPQIALSVHPTIQSMGQAVFRLYYGFEDEMIALADYAKNNGYERIAIAWINVPELEAAINDVLIPRLESHNILVVASNQHSFSTTDFRSIMANLAAAKPDLLILQDFGALLPSMLEAASSQGINNMVGGIGFLSAPENERSKLKGIPFVGPSFMVNESNEFKTFSERFSQASGGTAPTYDAVFSYDAMKILGNALAQSKKTNEPLAKTLAQIESFDGIAGHLTIVNRALKVPLLWGEFDEQGSIQDRSNPR